MQNLMDMGIGDAKFFCQSRDTFTLGITAFDLLIALAFAEVFVVFGFRGRGWFGKLQQPQNNQLG
jgi:hypothetical protein